MATKISRAVPRRPAEGIVKIAISLFGVFAVAWGGWSLPVFKAEASPQFVAAKILQGDSYKMPRLLLTARQAELVTADYAFCNPVALHSLTAIRLGVFKDTIGESDPTLFNLSYDALYLAAQRTLACSPADLFVWLTLFWIDAARHGLTAGNANYLRMSYASAPNEAWIALWRSHLAFNLFNRLRLISRETQSMASSSLCRPGGSTGKWRRFLKTHLPMLNTKLRSACKRWIRYPVGSS